MFRDRGVRVVGLHGDEDPKLLADFIAITGISFPVMHGQFTIVDFDFPTVGYPFPRQVIVDKNRVVRDIRNDLNVAEIEALITELLAE